MGVGMSAHTPTKTDSSLISERAANRIIPLTIQLDNIKLRLIPLSVITE